jgi:plasmid stabilization system protein ParE
MLRSVEYATRTTFNLKAIKAFVEQENPSAALRVIEYITDSTDGLLDFPLMGKPWTRAGTRKLVLSTFPYIDHLQADAYESDRAGRCASIAQEQTIAPHKKAMNQFI